MEENMEECKSKGEDCDMTSGLLCIADKAWEELMKDKLKHEWEKHRGETMDKVAEVVIQHSMKLWKHRMSSQDMKANLPNEEVDAFKEELGKAFMS